jgi:hypothetical protein
VDKFLAIYRRKKTKNEFRIKNPKHRYGSFGSPSPWEKQKSLFSKNINFELWLLAPVSGEKKDPVKAGFFVFW